MAFGVQIVFQYFGQIINKIRMLTRAGLFLIIAGLITGALNTLGLSIQSKQHVEEGGIEKTFFHPYMQATVKPASYCLVLLLIPFTNRKFQKDSDGSFNPLLLIIPITFEIIANCCYFFALNFVSSSSYQMLRGSNILVTYLIAVIFFKSQISKQKVLGCFVVVLGLASIGLVNSAFNTTKTHSESHMQVMGYFIILIGVIFTGLRFAFQQQLVKQHRLDPFWIIGLEGAFGLVISAMYIPLLSMISCPFGKNACVINDSGKMVFQDISVFMRGVLNNDMILLGGVVILITFSSYCLCGVLISKQINALARSMVDVTRSLLIWVVGIIVTLTLGANDKNFKWEPVAPKQLAGQALAFSILMLGNLIFYDIINIRYFEDNEEVETSVLAEEFAK